MREKWFAFGVLAVLLATAAGASGQLEEEVLPPQFMVGETFTFTKTPATIKMVGAEGDYYTIDVQMDVMGPQEFNCLMRKDIAGIERTWGTFIVDLDVVLDPPFSLFPLREYQEGTLMFHVYKPMRMDVQLNFTSEVVGVEEITVPAGTFECYHLAQEYELIYGTVPIDIWYSPEARMYPRIDVRNIPFGLGDIPFEMASMETLM